MTRVQRRTPASAIAARASAASPDISVPGLKQQIAALKARREELTQQRDRVSLAALKGDAAAKEAIALIDQQRIEINHNLETREAAVLALVREKRASPYAHLSYHLDWTRLAHKLAAFVSERREHLIWQLGRNQFVDSGIEPRVRIVDLQAALTHADPMTVARELIDGALPHPPREFQHDDLNATAEAARARDAQRKAEVNRLAVELVRQARLPATPEEITRAAAQIGIGG